jgi:hypothetical protein
MSTGSYAWLSDTSSSVASVLFGEPAQEAHPAEDGTADESGAAARSYRCWSCAASIPPSASACASTAPSTSASSLLALPSLLLPLLPALRRLRELRCRSSMSCA